jgi:hypothetical protein
MNSISDRAANVGYRFGVVIMNSLSPQTLTAWPGSTGISEPLSSSNKTLNDKSFRDQFDGLGLVVHMPNKPNEVSSFIQRDREKWDALIKTKQISLD